MACIGTFEFAAPLWRYPGADGWHFVSLPPELSADITAGVRRGFGSVRVAVTVGSTSWRTSIFPDSKTAAYLLPVRQSVRMAERLEIGDQVTAQLQPADLWPKSGDGGRADGPPVPLRVLDCHITPSRVVKNGMRTGSGSALLGVVIGAGPAGLAAGPLMTGEPGAAGMLWLWALVADGGWSADEGQGRP